MQGSPTGVSEHALQRTSGAELHFGNRIALLPNADVAYDNWLEAIRGARRWIHLENYIFRSDEVGTRFADALAERAQAGVTVRVLYDWYGSLGVPLSFWASLRARGVDVRAVNPPRLTDPLALYQRDHRKLLAVDGEYGSVAGMGIADAWLERAPDTGLPYRDTAVAIHGPAVADIERAFAGVWRLNGKPLPTAECPTAGSIPAPGGMAARVVVQEPGKMRISRMLQVLTAGVEHRIWIADAYFLADQILREALIAAARDGIDVRLLLPSTNDLPLVGALSRTSYRPLLQAGARIWEYRGPMMHAKTSLADGWCARIGSTNMNITGLMTNWEIDLIVQDEQFGTAMEEMFLRDLDDARELVIEGRSVRGGRGVRDVRQLSRVHGSRASSTIASLGGALAQGAISDVLDRNERNINAGVGLAAAVSALAVARAPKVLAWPVAAGLGLFAVERAARAVSQQRSLMRARRGGSR
ncbi:MAG: phospholipase D-like domain-containing protein [Dehalococcoidia bacterium]